MTCLGCELITYKSVTLRDGRTVCTSCPDWLLECEAKHCLTMNPTARRKYLDDVAKQRGAAAGEALRAAVAQVQVPA